MELFHAGVLKATQKVAEVVGGVKQLAAHSKKGGDASRWPREDEGQKLWTEVPQGDELP